MAAIDEGYNRFISHEAKATAESRRLNRFLYQVDAAVMSTIAGD